MANEDFLRAEAVCLAQTLIGFVGRRDRAADVVNGGGQIERGRRESGIVFLDRIDTRLISERCFQRSGRGGKVEHTFFGILRNIIGLQKFIDGVGTAVQTDDTFGCFFIDQLLRKCNSKI